MTEAVLLTRPKPSVGGVDLPKLPAPIVVTLDALNPTKWNRSNSESAWFLSNSTGRYLGKVDR